MANLKTMIPLSEASTTSNVQVVTISKKDINAIERESTKQVQRVDFAELYKRCKPKLDQVGKETLKNILVKGKRYKDYFANKAAATDNMVSFHEIVIIFGKREVGPTEVTWSRFIAMVCLYVRSTTGPNEALTIPAMGQNFVTPGGKYGDLFDSYVRPFMAPGYHLLVSYFFAEGFDVRENLIDAMGDESDDYNTVAVAMTLVGGVILDWKQFLAQKRITMTSIEWLLSLKDGTNAHETTIKTIAAITTAGLHVGMVEGKLAHEMLLPITRRTSSSPNIKKYEDALYSFIEGVKAIDVSSVAHA